LIAGSGCGRRIGSDNQGLPLQWPNLGLGGATNRFGLLRDIEQCVGTGVGQATKVDECVVSFGNGQKVRLGFIVLVVVSDNANESSLAIS
jgi:hypothetical protein